jgi:phosphoribosylaminoimidazole carboxylase (NCAIR synthetase)
MSIVAVRSRSGEIRCYPPGENVHRAGHPRVHGRAGAAPVRPLRATAATYVRRIMEALDYTGVLALEMFQHGDALLANEIAPRVHNTGHWTIEGADCSQFENHLRAILGWPLGSTAARGHVAMLNLIGRTPAVAGTARPSRRRTCTSTARSRAQAASSATSPSRPHRATSWRGGWHRLTQVSAAGSARHEPTAGPPRHR